MNRPMSDRCLQVRRRRGGPTTRRAANVRGTPRLGEGTGRGRSYRAAAAASVQRSSAGSAAAESSRANRFAVRAPAIPVPLN